MYQKIILVFMLHIATILAYRATVVEYDPIIGNQPSETITRNIEKYREIVEQNPSDIHVFPEYGLTGTDAVSIPERYSIEIPETFSPIREYTNVIRKLSDLAVEHSTHLVVNLLEKNGSLYYNTNVVLAKNGTLIAKYRKINLYEEPKLTPGNATVTFRTDFGEFGLFTCYDILFHHPSVTTLERSSSVTNIAFPTAWYSTLPLFVATSVQAGYATAHGVNLLAAGYSNPREGQSGASIILLDGSFSKDGVYVGGIPAYRPITQEIPSKPSRYNSCDKTLDGGVKKAGRGLDVGGNEFDNFFVKYDYKPSEYKFKDLDLSSKFSGEISKHGLTCNVTISTTKYNSSEHFKLVVGGDPSDNELPYVFCAILACTSDDEKSCGKVNQTTTKFSEITLRTNYVSTNESYERPVTLNGKYLPISDIRFCSRKSDKDEVDVDISVRDVDNVAVFGILHANSANTFTGSILFLIVVNVLRKYIY